MGEERMDAGVREFIGKFLVGPDFPLLQDFVEALRPHAPDVAAFDAFVQQWFFDVVVPEFKVESAECIPPTSEQGRWQTTVKVRNVGTGTVPLEVAVTNGEERWPDAELARTAEERAAAATQRSEYADARAQRVLTAGEVLELVIASEFEPKKVLVDPDVRTLMLNRKAAERDIAK
jgi:hypothetical protein